MGGADQIDARHRRADQPDQAEPEAVPVGDGVALDQPAGGERRGEPGGGGLVDTEPAPEVGHPELALLGDQFERPHRAGDRLDPADLVVAHGATLSCLAQSGLVRLGRHAVLAGRGAKRSYDVIVVGVGGTASRPPTTSRATTTSPTCACSRSAGSAAATPRGTPSSSARTTSGTRRRGSTSTR